MVGARGFEPPTSRSRTVRATRLRYAPNGPAHYTGIRGSRLPGVLSHELHELALPALPRARLAARALHDGEHLVLGAADGQHQAPALDELLHQRRPHRRPARGALDATEGRFVRPADRPVADTDPDVGHAQRLERGPRALGPAPQPVGRAHAARA